MGDLFDLHPPFGRRNQGGHGYISVNDRPDVVFLCDVRRFRDDHPIRDHPVRAGLLVHHLHADERLCDLGDFLAGFGEFHAPRLAAAACMDLDLHDSLVQFHLSGYDRSASSTEAAMPKSGMGIP